MDHDVSPNAQAILLLTAPLHVGRGGGREEVRRLTPKRQYLPLIEWLAGIGREPGDLIGPEGVDVLDEALASGLPNLDRAQIEELLGRGYLLGVALDRWRTRAVWVLSSFDEGYPDRLREALGDEAPPLLYGCGDRSFLNDGGLAIVGPRAADEELLEYARSVGELAASAGRTVVSGAARGVDRAAMTGALDVGGRTIGVLHSELARAAVQRENRDAVLDERLLLVSPHDPAARFQRHNAMRRNHYVYALADAALVVDALKGKGGTWTGATDQLARCSSSPVYVRSTLDRSEGLAALEDRGALQWPNPESPQELEVLFDQRDVEPAVTGERRSQPGATEASNLAAADGGQPHLPGVEP